MSKNKSFSEEKELVGGKSSGEGSSQSSQVQGGSLADHDGDQAPDHMHEHMPDHAHDHSHDHSRGGSPAKKDETGGSVLVLRPNSGISGDIMVAGLAALVSLSQTELDELLADLGLSDLIGRVKLGPRTVDGIAGQGLHVDLAPEKVHRTLADVERFLADSRLTEGARELALSAFRILAEAEGRVHNRPPEEVHFHEVGAVDSLLDIGLASAIFDRLAPSVFVSGPLPLCDGTIACAHGLLSSPAPAVSALLEGVMVCGLDSYGETVTPTGLALLKSFGVIWGAWPTMTVEKQALAFGTRILPKVPNGAMFAFGRLNKV
ncbi:MAG: LarC family nickel insertion protein [Deltaproteobacteria bacterium]|nr:LarC family nickel insertion protein [Deltaproteobacteria bacterium]